jgi:hypothetical protein
MADKRIWSSGDKLVALADTELECKKTTQSAITPPAEESPRDNKCGAEKESGSNVCAPNATKQRPNGILDHARIAVACRARDSDDYFRQRNSPTNDLDNGFIKEDHGK